MSHIQYIYRVSSVVSSVLWFLLHLWWRCSADLHQTEGFSTFITFAGLLPCVCSLVISKLWPLWVSFPMSLHLKGFSPVSIFWSLVRFDFTQKDFPQSLHSCFLPCGNALVIVEVWFCVGFPTILTLVGLLSCEYSGSALGLEIWWKDFLHSSHT